MLRIPLSQITEHGFRVDAETTVAELQPQGVEGLPVDRVWISGTLTAVSADYLFQGRIRGCFVQPCDRCLEPAHAPVDVEVVWEFVEGPETTPRDTVDASDDVDDAEDFQDGARHPFQGGEIDLGPHVWEELVLAMPFKYLCREDCKGLCPHCGANRNITPCSCDTDEPAKNEHSEGLAGLADLFPDLRPGNPKE